ncbi:MAG TPA: FkbM family methyltransferase [Steroidobacteraceae bacterium]|nr:FkbM family methyltransferase [Steroidobacteraceae bacterium]
MLSAIAKQSLRKDHYAFLGWYRNRFGDYAATKAAIRLINNPNRGIVPARRQHGEIRLRPGSADQAVYDEVFFAGEYDVDLGSPETILDIGAHIGCASLFFAHRYPKATIIAVEPEPSNFALLAENTRNYGSITAINAALWHSATELIISHYDSDTWGFRVSSSGIGASVPAIDVPGLMQLFSIQRIDVLKVDIEGAEIEVLGNSQGWLDCVGTLIIELHDRFRPGCWTALESALKNYSFRRGKSGESLIISHIERRT